MTTQNDQTPDQQKEDDKTRNFRALENKYEAQLQQERQARLEMEEKLNELTAKQKEEPDDDEDDDLDYVNKKKLNKTLTRFNNQAKMQTQTEIQKAVNEAIRKEKEARFLEDHPDFFDVLEQHAEKLAVHAPKLAQRILELPNGPERQKLVYENIKTLGLDKPPQKQSSIQEKVDSNRKSPYYQPTGIGSAPYAQVSDFSQNGQEQSYKKMQELKKNLRL